MFKDALARRNPNLINLRSTFSNRSGTAKSGCADRFTADFRGNESGEADRKIEVPLSCLKVGMKCGGSDGFLVSPATLQWGWFLTG